MLRAVCEVDSRILCGIDIEDIDYEVGIRSNIADTTITTNYGLINEGEEHIIFFDGSEFERVDIVFDADSYTYFTGNDVVKSGFHGTSKSGTRYSVVRINTPIEGLQYLETTGWTSSSLDNLSCRVETKLKDKPIFIIVDGVPNE